MIRVTSYLSCLPKSNAKNEKVDSLVKFARGADLHADTVGNLHHGRDMVQADVGVILGWVHADSPNSPHLQVRRNVIEHQTSRGQYVVSIDSNLFLYKNTDNPHHYLRYSFNGIFPNTGIYCDDQIDPARWEKISVDIGIRPKQWRNHGDHILFTLQRNGGWSMGKTSVPQWLTKTYHKIRQYTDRPIVLRPHPGDRAAKDYVQRWINQSGLVNVGISKPKRSLEQDLENCWAVVAHNSSPTVGAAIEGIPIFVTDPERSQCAEIANKKLSSIENPRMPDRLPWLQRLSMFHWNFDDLESGRAWSHMRNYIQ